MGTSKSERVSKLKQYFASIASKEKGFINKPNEFIDKFCKGHLEELEVQVNRLQEKAGGDEKKLVKIANKAKYIRSWLELAQCYGTQLAIMTDEALYRARALEYMSSSYAAIQDMDMYGESAL